MSTATNQDELKTAPVAEQPETAQNFVSPEVNIHETTDGYVLEADLPGVNKTGLDIAVEANILTITGHRTQVNQPAEPVYRGSHPSYDYRRAFELDPAIDTAKIDARLEQGVLTVRLPKSERAKTRKVQVSD